MNFSQCYNFRGILFYNQFIISYEMDFFDCPSGTCIDVLGLPTVLNKWWGFPPMEDKVQKKLFW